MPLTIVDEPKIDCHVHVFDPHAFPYLADTFYAPSGQEVGTPDQFLAVMEAYGSGMLCSSARTPPTTPITASCSICSPESRPGSGAWRWCRGK